MRISDWSSDVCSSDLDARDLQRQIKESSGHDARLYLQARATSQVAVDPIDLQLTGPRRTAIELIEYLWKRKFCKAAAQCTGERGAFLVFEWEGIEDTAVFREDRKSTRLNSSH